MSAGRYRIRAGKLLRQFIAQRVSVFLGGPMILGQRHRISASAVPTTAEFDKKDSSQSRNADVVDDGDELRLAGSHCG